MTPYPQLADVEQFAPIRDVLADRFLDLSSKRQPKIAVIGDYCLDKYLYIYPELDEVSVETRLTAFQVRNKRIFPGVGGTIASNLRALGAETFCFGVLGNDGEGYDLRNALSKIGANVDGFVISDMIATGTYMKPMRPSAPLSTSAVASTTLQSPNEGVWIEDNRIDIRNPFPVPDELVETLQKKIRDSVDKFDAVIISDQFPSSSATLFSNNFRQFLSGVAKANPETFWLCDSRFGVDKFQGALVKCNAFELFDAKTRAVTNQDKQETSLDSELENNEQELCESGIWLANKIENSVLVTRGDKGSLLFERKENARVRMVAIPPVRVEPPIDICGAGDATNAGFAFARALGFEPVEAAFLAGVVSSITIKQIGVTGVASVRGVVDVLRNGSEAQTNIRKL